MNKKRVAVIFDFDNTLVKSNINFPAMKIHMARAVKEFGLDFGAEEEIPLKYTAGNIIDEAAKYDEENETTLANQLWDVVENFEREGMKNISIDDDVFSMLKVLKEHGIPMAILTNNSREPTIEVLDRYSLRDYFELVIAREDVTRMKPDKEGIEKIIEKLSWNHEMVVFVGDSWVDGVAAKNANVRFILFRKEKLNPGKYDIKIWKHLTSMKELFPTIIPS
ncbi:MAG: HAD-IA family hydrolase [Asgard group archaeon]|nr:HAD-IA family hydrolase [Asgard group archaeon]